MTIYYRGMDRHGTACTGTVPEGTTVEFVRRRFHAGWHTLTVTDGPHVVGGVGAPWGRRIWWAEDLTGGVDGTEQLPERNEP